MLRLTNVEEIQNSLIESSRLISLASEKSTQFVPESKQWLIRLETILSQNKLPECGIVSSLRGTILSSEIGVVPEGFTLPVHSTSSRLKTGVTLYVIRKVNELLMQIIQKDIERFGEATRIVMQIISIARVKGLLANVPTSLTSEILKSYWQKLAADKEILTGITSVEGLVGIYDCLIIFDRALSRI